MRLRAFVSDPDGSRVRRRERSGLAWPTSEDGSRERRAFRWAWSSRKPGSGFQREPSWALALARSGSLLPVGASRAHGARGRPRSLFARSDDACVRWLLHAIAFGDHGAIAVHVRDPSMSEVRAGVSLLAPPIAPLLPAFRESRGCR